MSNFHIQRLVHFYTRFRSFSILNRGPTTLLRLERCRTAASRAPASLGVCATRRPRPHAGRGVLLPHAPRPEAWESSRPRARHGLCRTGSVRAADRWSVGGTPLYACRSRWPCYDGISVVTAASPGRFVYKTERRPTLRAPHQAVGRHYRPRAELGLFPRNQVDQPPSDHPLGHAVALGLTHCLAKSPTRRRTEPPRLPPPAIAVRSLRQILRPNSGYPQALGEQVAVAHRFSGRERGRLAGIRPEPPPPHGQGPDCKPPNSSRVFSVN
jgi:hypothetical protein